MDFPFLTDIRHPATYPVENPLPRSIQRASPFELLDGTWYFDLDPLDAGIRESWYAHHHFTQTALWPGSIENHLINLQHDMQQQSPWQDHVIAWYHRTFTIPNEWQDRLVQVTLGACGYETRLWFNGHELITLDNERVHYGGYTSFSYELPKEYWQEINALTIRITASMDDAIPRGKQESHVYKRGGIWYQTISGGIRSIWIEPVERNRLRSRLSIMTHPEREMVEFNITTRVTDPGRYTVRLIIALADNATSYQKEEFTLDLAAGEKHQWMAVRMPHAQYWSPENPVLYHLEAQLISPDQTISRIFTHFGLRQVETRDHAIYLNGHQTYLDGILYQPGTATYEQIQRHMQAMKDLGCNLVRIHIAGVDPRIYDLADQMGMLLWVEVPSPHVSSQQSRANHWAELQRLMQVIGTHPSIIIMSLYNEDWGAEDIASNATTRMYIASAYDFMRLRYPHLMIVDNDGWHHVSRDGQLTSNIYSAHIYQTDEQTWNDSLDRLVAGDNLGVAVKPLVVGDPFFYRGQAAVIVSEWGGFGFVAYGGPSEMNEKIARIISFKRALRSRQIGGDVYTQATSIEEEVNGLIDFKTGTLLVPPGILRSEPTSPLAGIEMHAGISEE